MARHTHNFVKVADKEDDIGITSATSEDRIKGTLNFVLTVLSNDHHEACYLWRSLRRSRQKEISQRLLYYIPTLLQGIVVGPAMRKHPRAFDDFIGVTRQLMDMVSVLNYELDRAEAQKESFLKGFGRRLRRPTEGPLLKQALLQNAVKHHSRWAYEPYAVPRAPAPVYVHAPLPEVRLTPPTPLSPPMPSLGLPLHRSGTRQRRY